MSLRVGFAQADITPPLGTHKIGWLVEIIGDAVADPLSAFVGVFECDGQAVAFVSLDTLSIRWTTTQQIRAGVTARYGFPGERVMVAATHNHAGPAVACLPVRDDAYVATLVEQVVTAFGQALAAMVPAEVGLGWGFEFEASHNRRVVMRDGTVKCHGQFADPNALCLEGPIDPEVAVIAARAKDGTPLGLLINYTCHPTHHGGDTVFSAGYPGALARTLQARGWPVPVFLQGAAGNVHFANPYANGNGLDMEPLGERLADDVERVVAGLDWRSSLRIGSRQRTLELPYRRVSPAEVANVVHGAQPFRPELYQAGMPSLVQRIHERQVQPAELQVHDLDEFSLVSVPAEYFVEYGLQIKQAATPRHALVVGYANGMVGYVPTRKAFAGGGYETTFTHSSRMGIEAGEMIAAAAGEMIGEGRSTA